METVFDTIGLGSMEDLLVQAELLLRIGISCVLGLLIGHERKNRNKSAGIRTHAIVAMGAALIMIVSKYGFFDVESYDAARVAAQVVSGVGFLGAGVIFVRNNLVSGLTTAAGIWATAGVGLAMGCGLYVIGIVSALMIVLIQELMHRIDYFAQVASCGTIRMTIVKKAGAVKSMEEYLESCRVDIASAKVHQNKNDEIKVEFEVIYPPGLDKAGLFSKLAENDAVMTISD